MSARVRGRGERGGKREEGRGRERGRTGLLGALDDEVVDHDADVAVRAGEDERGLVQGGEAGVDAGDDALACGFFVARRAWRGLRGCVVRRGVWTDR